MEPYLVEPHLVEPHLVKPYLVEPHLVEPYLIYIAEESVNELHPADSENGVPIIFLELPSITK